MFKTMGYTVTGSAPSSPATQPAAPSPYPGVQAEAVLADFARRLGDLEKAVKLQVPSDRITSMIALTKDTALIMADKIGMLGEVTFADWHRDISGQAVPGQIDPSITTIRGGVIRTEKVLSLDGQSWLDLDATGATPFLRARDAVAIYPDGTFRLGGALGTKTLIWDGANLSLDGSSLLAGYPTSSVVSNANYGATRSVGDITASVLANSATAITMTSSQLFRSGSGSAGVFIGAGGITAKNNLGVDTFALDGATGSALFSGSVTAGSIITNSVTVDGQTLGNIAANANYGASRSVGDITASVLSNSATAITMTSSQLFRSGSGSAGVFIGAGGITAKNALGVDTFALDGATGSAFFSGNISGATGTFAGDITTSGHVYATGNYVYAGGLVASIIGRPSNVNSAGIYGASTNQQGVLGATANGAGVQGTASSSGYGVLGIASSASAIGINAVNNFGGTALRVAGAMTITHPELVTNLNADMLDSWHAGNASGAIPISNGLQNANLNADMVDYYHAGNTNGTIPISNSQWNDSLAAMWASRAAKLYDANWGHYMSLGTAGGVAGSYAPTLGSACPRPGPPTWLQVIVDGTTGYMPVFF